jgi:putative FmdB family regulatory protein
MSALRERSVCFLSEGNAKMPLYEYTCQKCNEASEILVRSSSDTPVCTHCGSKKLTKLLSVTAAPNIAGTNRSLPTCEPTPQSCSRPQCGSGGCMFGN